MAIIKRVEQKPKKHPVGVGLCEETKERLDRFIKHVGRNRNEIVEIALNYAMDRDKAFVASEARPVNGHARAKTV